MRSLFFVCLFMVSLNLSAAFSYKVVSGGKLAFFFEKNGIQENVVPEFFQVIKVRGNQIFLGKRQIGKIFEGKIIVCGKEFGCELNFGIKGDIDSTQKIKTVNLTFSASRRGFALNRYVLPSPDQLDAGTCLYMATTGAMEIIYGMQHPELPLILNGDGDLSERFLLNARKKHNLSYWVTDLIKVFNKEGGALLNRDYPYTMGWFKKTDGVYYKMSSSDEGAEYGPKYNWISELFDGHQSQMVILPQVSRKLLFVDSGHNRWNTGVMDESIIESIKKELDKNRPVIAIYNHFSYWHAVDIVGYDDNVETEQCPFVKIWIEETQKQIDKYMAIGSSSSLNKAHKYRRYIEQINDSMEENGGCRTKGVFYVRDSIYEGPEDYMYDYDASVVGEERPYAARIIGHSYDWIKYLGNHAYSVYAAP